MSACENYAAKEAEIAELINRCAGLSVSLSSDLQGLCEKARQAFNALSYSAQSDDPIDRQTACWARDEGYALIATLAGKEAEIARMSQPQRGNVGGRRYAAHARIKRIRRSPIPPHRQREQGEGRGLAFPVEKL